MMFFIGVDTQQSSDTTELGLLCRADQAGQGTPLTHPLYIPHVRLYQAVLEGGTG